MQLRTETILSRHVPRGSRVALLDFPNHRNAGDSLIYQGERAYFDRLDIEVAYEADIATFSRRELERRVPVGPILIHGGGNLGDRWTRMQAFREELISTFPEYPIVQLPQSIDFTGAEALARAQRVFGAHPKLVLLLRERPSLSFAEEKFASNTIDFCPDLALGVAPLQPSRSPDVDIVVLLRTDLESVRTQPIELPDTVTSLASDWRLGPWRETLWQALRVPGFVARKLDVAQRPVYPLLRGAYRAKAELNVAVARNLLSRGRVVLTDRLHATLLAYMLGKPVIALDSANGKVHNVLRSFLETMTDSGIHLAKDESEAQTLAIDLVARA